MRAWTNREVFLILFILFLFELWHTSFRDLASNLCPFDVAHLWAATSAHKNNILHFDSETIQRIIQMCRDWNSCCFGRQGIKLNQWFRQLQLTMAKPCILFSYGYTLVLFSKCLVEWWDKVCQLELINFAVDLDTNN